MTIFSKTFLVVLVSLTVICVTAYIASRLWNSGMQSDEKLKIIYMKHRDSFTKLERLFVDDPTLRYASSSKFHRNNGHGLISDSEPPDKYRSIFDQTGIISGGRSGVIDVAFISFPTFLVQLDGGDFSERFFEEKGYALILEPDEKVRELLGTGRVYGNVEFKQIEHHWYIYKRIKVSKPE